MARRLHGQGLAIFEGTGGYGRVRRGPGALTKIVLVAVILALAGAIGWMVYRRLHPNNAVPLLVLGIELTDETTDVPAEDVITMPDGTRVYINIGDARITGFELSAARRTGWLQASANYTFLDAVNEDADRPLDLTPRHQANAIVDILPSDPWRISLWGLAASRCQTLNGSKVVEAAGYFLANVGATYRFHDFELYAQAENLLDKAYMTEPGYPLAGRSFKVGLRWAYDRD